MEWELHEWLYDCDMRGDLPTPGERFGREDMTRCFYRYMEHDVLTGEDNCEAYLDAILDEDELDRVAEIFRDKLSEEYEFLDEDEEE